MTSTETNSKSDTCFKHIYGVKYVSERDSTVMTQSAFCQIELQIDHPTQISQWVKNPKPRSIQLCMENQA